MAGLSNSELLDFTGGVNTVTAPHLVALNEALELVNTNLTYGSLKSVPFLNNTSSAQGSFFVEYRRKLYYYENWRSNALVDDKLYWADGISSGKILPDGTEHPLGIATPATPPTIASSGNVGSGPHKGDYKYTYTFYSSTTGVESAPSPLPHYVTVDEQDIVVSGLEALPVGADRYRIYRIGGYLTRFTLVKTIAAVDVPFTDDIDETLIDGRLLQTLRSGTPPTGITNFVELGGRLFGSVENRVYFSGLGNPDAWYSDDFFNMPDAVIGLAKVPAGLLVLGLGYVYLIYGTSPSSFRRKVVSDYIGCISAKSIAYYNDKVLWLGTDGVMMSDGYAVKNITYRKISRISAIDISSAVVANDVYYMSFKPAMVPSDTLFPADDLFPGGATGIITEEGGSTEGIMAMDFRRGNMYSFHHLEYLNSLSLGIYKGELYMVLDGTKEPILCAQTFNCSTPFCYGEQILAKLGGTDTDIYKKLSYISPQLIDGSYSTLKEYDKVRVNYIGQFTVSVIFSDGTEAIVQEISSKNLVYSEQDLKGLSDDVAIIGIPNDNNQSYSIQFKIEGRGIVKSIQYSWKNRELA